MLTGSPMREVIQQNRAGVAASTVLEAEQLTRNGYFLVSLHREENVDNAARLESILRGLEQLGTLHGLPVLVSTHPRTRKRVESLGTRFSGLSFHKPFGFHDYLALQSSAALVLSDSGTIAEEASVLGFPAVTLRDAIERPEAQDTGSILLTGADEESIIRTSAYALSTKGESAAHDDTPAAYMVENTSHRVVSMILSTTPSHHHRLGIRGTGS